MRTDKVLIVDDNVWIRRLLATILKREGYPSCEAHDGLEAIEQIGQEEFAGIILDLMMPRADGFDVINYLKGSHPEMLPRTIVLTADSSRWSADELQGVGNVVRKPFDVGEFVPILKQTFGE